MASVTKEHVHLRGQRLEAVHKRSVDSDQRVAARLLHHSRDATGPVALWDGEPAATSADHDRIYDES